MNWCEVESLENGLLFLSRGLSNSMLIPVAKETSDLRNSVHVVYANVGCISAFQNKEFEYSFQKNTFEVRSSQEIYV